MSKHRAYQASLSTAASAAAETDRPAASTGVAGCARGQIGRRSPGEMAAVNRPARVLLVEEGPLSLMMLNAALVDADFEVIPSHSVADALTHVQSGSARPDAMVINMEGSRPDCARAKLVSLARRRWPTLAVLATSADSDPAVSGMATVTQTMTGPIVLEDLVAHLHELLASRASPGLHGPSAGSPTIH